MSRYREVRSWMVRCVGAQTRYSYSQGSPICIGCVSFCLHALGEMLGDTGGLPLHRPGGKVLPCGVVLIAGI
jgi:hypothetical protein